MRVTVLGSGTSTGVPVVTCDCEVCRSDDPRDRRSRPSVHLAWSDASVLVDTSTDFREQALRHGIRRLDAVLYTHHHADHVLGLDELRLFHWRQGGPIPLYGNRETLAAIRRTFWYVFEDGPAGGGKPRVLLREVQGPFGIAGRTVVPVPVRHGTLEILGYRIGGFAYLTDVSDLPEMSYALLEGLEVLLMSALRPRPHPTHQSLEQALERARRIGASRTILTHLGHEMPYRTIAAALPAGVDLAYDGLSFEVAP